MAQGSNYAVCNVVWHRFEEVEKSNLVNQFKPIQLIYCSNIHLKRLTILPQILINQLNEA